MRKLLLTAVALSGIATIAAITSPARATDIFQTYDLTWAGVNTSASATATMTLDLTTLPDTSGFGQSILGSVTALSVTVTGASSGNGTFPLSDFSDVFMETPGVTQLNMNEQLVGQLIPNFCGPPGSTIPWGTTNEGCSGSFMLDADLSSFPSAPTSVFDFQLAADGGHEDLLQLTSFAPSVPEPMSAALFASGLIGVGWLRRRAARRTA